MAESRFVYVTYIRTTLEKLWQALIDPEFTRRYWCETTQDCDWKPGASWRIMIPDGRVADSGEIIEPAFVEGSDLLPASPGIPGEGPETVGEFGELFVGFVSL